MKVTRVVFLALFAASAALAQNFANPDPGPAVRMSMPVQCDKQDNCIGFMDIPRHTRFDHAKLERKGDLLLITYYVTFEMQKGVYSPAHFEIAYGNLPGKGNEIVDSIHIREICFRQGKKCVKRMGTPY